MTTTYDSDSSAGDDIETGVTLGYASEEPTGDDFSRLGGHPVGSHSIYNGPAFCFRMTIIDRQSDLA